jgi:hypothetical protein
VINAIEICVSRLPCLVRLLNRAYFMCCEWSNTLVHCITMNGLWMNPQAVIHGLGRNKSHYLVLFWLNGNPRCCLAFLFRLLALFSKWLLVSGDKLVLHDSFVLWCFSLWSLFRKFNSPSGFGYSSISLSTTRMQSSGSSWLRMQTLSLQVLVQIFSPAGIETHYRGLTRLRKFSWLRILIAEESMSCRSLILKQLKLAIVDCFSSFLD